MTIPDEAVNAAEATLLAYTGGCSCHEGYKGRNLIDPDCVYHDVPPEVATLILQAAAPYMLREAQEVAWAKGATSAGLNLMALQSAGINPNPYSAEPKHSMHAPGEWFYACEACSGLPDGDKQ